MKYSVSLPNGQTLDMSSRDEWVLKDAMRDAGVNVIAQCGGGCVCATCHVHVAPEWYDKLDAPSVEELAMLEESDEYVPGRSRLSCQLVCKAKLDGIKVSLTAESWEA
jgi:ferredoxin, 2Fe-2S